MRGSGDCGLFTGYLNDLRVARHLYVQRGFYVSSLVFY